MNDNLEDFIELLNDNSPEVIDSNQLVDKWSEILSIYKGPIGQSLSVADKSNVASILERVYKSPKEFMKKLKNYIKSII